MKSAAKLSAARRRPAKVNFELLVAGFESDPGMLSHPMFEPTLRRLHEVLCRAYGRKLLSDETRARMSEAKRAVPLTERHKDRISDGVSAALQRRRIEGQEN